MLATVGRLLLIASIVLTYGACCAPSCAAEGQVKNPWEPAIERFEQEDADHPPAANSIVFVGSSSIRLWDLKKSFPGVPTLNRGFGGSHVADSAHYAERIVCKYQPKLVVFYAGDNDLASGKSPERVRDDVKRFVDVVRSSLPKTKVIFLSIKPSPARIKLAEKQRQANAMVQAQFAGDADFEYVDVGACLLDNNGQPRRELFLGDGLHLNADGYKLWTEILGSRLQ